jgi:predicted nucleic acid-binding protein
MKKIFLDTNVILDLLAMRSTFYDAIAKIATLADELKLILLATPISFATVEYIQSKFESHSSLSNKLRRFKIICQDCMVDEEVTEKALNADLTDFEDALKYFSALKAMCSVIITRNNRDFQHSSIPIMTAEEFLSSL